MARSVVIVFSLASLIILVVTVPALAQITAVNSATSTPTEGLGHDYTNLSETVNPATGGLSLRVEVPTPKGRGLTLPFSFNYDSAGARHLWSGVFFKEIGQTVTPYAPPA